MTRGHGGCHQRVEILRKTADFDRHACCSYIGHEVSPMRTMLKTVTLTALMLTAFVSTAAAQVSIGIHIGPPPPPPVVRVAPVAPAPGYVWVQGYWYPVGPSYRWRAGYWAAPPYTGAYWV